MWVKTKRRFAGSIASAFVAATLTMPTYAAAPPPVEAFGRLPMIRSVKLSPSGTHFAAIQSYQGEKILAVYDMAGKPGKNLRVMSFKGTDRYDEELRRIFWVNDTRLIAVIEVPAVRYGTRVLETRMIAMNADLSSKQVIPKPKHMTRSMSGEWIAGVPQFQDRVLNRLADEPDTVLLSLDRKGLGRELNVYKLDVYNGRLKKVLSGNNSKIAAYVADRAGEVRIRYRYIDSKDDFVTELRGTAKSKWTGFLSDDTDGLGDYSVEAFSEDPDRLFVSKRGKGGRDEIHELDLGTATIIRKVFAHDFVDVDGMAFDETGDRVIGVQFVDDRPRVDYFDSVWQQMQASIDTLLPGRYNALVSRDTAGDKWVVFSSSDRDAGTFYIYLKAANQLLEIGKSYPGLQDYVPGLVEDFSFEARDGLTIPGYLTKPSRTGALSGAGAGPGPLPMVVMPHGGPNARDTKSFDPRRQFLVSRGYVVFQPNFRGSAGFGADFEEAGHHQWGLKMQDDITDGTKALIDLGIADPERICIVGASYGGYAALMGAVKTPDLFKCAASFGGVTDIEKLMVYRNQYKFSSYSDPRIGNRWDDRGRIRDTSPANNVDAITIPVLLMHGENDRSVPVEQSELMAKRLKRAKKPHKFIIFEGGDHNLSFEKNSIRYLREIEAFLKANIGSKPSPGL